jgi:myosin-5
VLDIYGFEHFDKNSFEQFCINYANEKLQQEFNQRVFRMEQEEYVREKINWSYIEFSDNQACIDIVEGKIGVLSLLDEEARLPGGKDENFLNKLHSNFGVPKHEQYYKKPRFARTSFTICHYACDVTYDSEGFIDKNKDSVPDELMEVVMTSQFEFMVDMIKQAEEQAKLLAEENESAAPKAAASKFARPGAAATPKKPTLGSIFKQSLVDLMATINKTNVHYIRCIKPNEAKEAFKFEAHMVLGQLRACGVLETIKISSKGYPTKRTLGEFIDRYRLLAPTKSWRDDPRALIPLVLNAVGLTEDKYQVGNTKIFFRAGQLARMEQMRTDKLKKCVILIQKYMYGNYIRKYYAKLRECTINIQRRWRAKLELRRLRRERDQVLATKLQATWKMYKARKAFNKEVAKVVLAQAMVKGYIARQAYKTKKRDDAVICLQRHTRGFLARKQYQKTRHNVILVQSLARRRTARKEYKKLRVEAKSMSNVKYQLENKVVELTQNLQTQTAKNNEYMYAPLRWITSV